MEVKGLREVQEKLKELQKKTSNKLTKKALRAGAKIVQAEAKADAPSISGTIKKSIKVRAGKRRKGSLSIVVGIGKKWFAGPMFYAAFVLLGHKIGKRSGSHRKKDPNDKRKAVPPHNFLKDAYERTKNRALDTMISTLSESVENAVNGGE